MWVITAVKGLENHREERLSDILGEHKPKHQEIFLKGNSSGYTKFTVTSLKRDALIYKQQHSCVRLIKKFEENQKKNLIPHYDKFLWIKDYKLSFRKLSKEEWESICDEEISILTKSYETQKNILLNKKNSYKR